MSGAKRQKLNGRARQAARRDFAAHLIREAVAASGLFEEPRGYKWRQADPSFGRGEQERKECAERIGQSAKVAWTAFADHRQLKVPIAALGPGSSQAGHRTLGLAALAHRREDEYMINTPVVVEIKRKDMGMLVGVPQRLASFVFAGQFGAIHPPAVAEPGNNCFVYQLGLRQGPGD